ncbi:hypothetical protein Sxan_72170 [Streptomyces xanthophaeus]|uniref:Uncharacterized protein n=1 Tax=Streptomyces xanthophaeus TaxID=67385 RepID=A0A919LCN0_9ACTN|nr:hypothetical protein Sxan_72170 [Streptomyces xanthophaeus]
MRARAVAARNVLRRVARVTRAVWVLRALRAVVLHVRMTGQLLVDAGRPGPFRSTDGTTLTCVDGWAEGASAGSTLIGDSPAGTVRRG